MHRGRHALLFAFLTHRALANIGSTITSTLDSSQDLLPPTPFQTPAPNLTPSSTPSSFIPTSTLTASAGTAFHSSSTLGAKVSDNDSYPPTALQAPATVAAPSVGPSNRTNSAPSQSSASERGTSASASLTTEHSHHPTISSEINLSTSTPQSTGSGSSYTSDSSHDVGASSTATEFLAFLSIIQILASSIEATATSNTFVQSTGAVKPSMSASASPTTTNAVSILLSALPSSAALSFESEYSQLPTDTQSSTASTTQPTTVTTSSQSITTDSSSSTTAASTISPIQSTLSTSTRPSSSPSSVSSVTPTSTGTTPIATAPSTTIAPASVSTVPTSTSRLSKGATAGIAAGTVAGFVIALLLLVFLLRRRQQRRPPFHRGFLARTSSTGRSSRGSRRIFPEVAWLYDPVMTPPQRSNSQASPSVANTRQEMMANHNRSNSSEHLAPDAVAAATRSRYADPYHVQDRAAEAPEVVPSAVSTEYSPFLPYQPYRSPELPPFRPTTPLLTPELLTPAMMRDGNISIASQGSSSSGVGGVSPAVAGVGRYSPHSNGGSSRGSENDPTRRPMTAIWEEPGIAR